LQNEKDDYAKALQRASWHNCSLWTKPTASVPCTQMVTIAMIGFDVKDVMRFLDRKPHNALMHADMSSPAE
jgi:hypothetical protein